MAGEFVPAGTELTKVEVCFPAKQTVHCEVYDFSTGDKQGWDIIVNYGTWTGQSFEAAYLIPPTNKYIVHIRKAFPAGTVVTGLKWYWNNTGSKHVYAEKDNWTSDLVSLPGNTQSVTVVNGLNETININLAMAGEFVPAGTELTKVEVCFPAKLVFLPYLITKPGPKAAAPPAAVINNRALLLTRSLSSPATTTTR
jgi:hypothetical protein